MGIFGIDQKEKEIGYLEKLHCKNCDKMDSCYVIKEYTYFHIFFIPIFKWNVKYYVICRDCNKVYVVPKEKGERIENGEKNLITYWDLKEVGHAYGIKRCTQCSREVSAEFEYCPYCGTKL